MLNRILPVFLLFLSHFGLANENPDEMYKLLQAGEHVKVIELLEPKIESGNYESVDYSFLITAYVLKQDYFNALAHSNKWLNISLEKGDTSNVIYAAGNKMDVLYRLGDLDGSIAAGEFGLKYYRLADSVENAVTNIRLGMYYWEKGNADLAYDIYTKIKFEDVCLAKLESSYFNNFGVIYHALEIEDSTIYYLRQAMEYNPAFDQENQRALQYSNLAVTCIDFKNYDLALSYLDSASLINTQHSSDVYQKVYENYFVAYNDLGMADSALVYVHKLKELNQTLFLEKMELETKELEDQYERELDLKTEIIQSDQELEESKLQLLLSIIMILLIVVIAAAAILFLRYRNLKVSRNNLLTTQQLLRSQITPHFLYNSLSTIQGMILKKENKLASNYLSKFSKLVRLILKNSRNKSVSLSDELEAIKYYLDLQNARFSEVLEYSIHLDRDIEGDDVYIPPMLIQPFVENCIEHGFNSIDRKGKIDINIYFEHEALICKITDNGIGFETKAPETIIPKKESISTGITTERMLLLSKEFKSKASVEIIDRKKFKEKGTIVTLEIPYKYD